MAWVWPMPMARSIGAIIRFGPPAVEDRGSAGGRLLVIARPFHSRWPHWLPRVSRCGSRKPDVDLLDAGCRATFIARRYLSEDDAGGGLVELHRGLVNPDNILDQLLAHPVLGVGLAAKDDLDQPVARADQLDQPFHVLQDQARTFARVANRRAKPIVPGENRSRASICPVDGGFRFFSSPRLGKPVGSARS